jgi:hypothetical protein
VHHARSEKRYPRDDHFPAKPRKIPQAPQKTKKPVVLTVNGKAEAVVQDAEAYQRLLDIAAQVDVLEGIRQSVEDMKAGRVYPARKFLQAFRRKHGIPR